MSVNDRPLIKLDARSSNWEEPRWPSSFELARLLPRSSWTLVGGLMVKLHAAVAGLPAPRTTVDVDSALHLETQAISFAYGWWPTSAACSLRDPSRRGLRAQRHLVKSTASGCVTPCMQQHC
jgi:hypothetical protein